MFPCPFILPAAFLLDILAGEPPNRFHPVCLIGRCAHRMETLAVSYTHLTLPTKLEV